MFSRIRLKTMINPSPLKNTGSSYFKLNCKEKYKLRRKKFKVIRYKNLIIDLLLVR
jgi:hypothetical protein